MAYSNVLSTVAVTISAGALYVSWRAFRATQQAARAAALRVHVDTDEWEEMVIENVGQSTARAVRGWVDGVPFDDVAYLFRHNSGEIVVGPHSSVSIGMALHLGIKPPRLVRLEWEDDTGRRGEYETSVT